MSRQLLIKGVRVQIIAPPHNSKRAIAAGEVVYDQTGVVTREGSSANGGWFEILLDGTEDKHVYYRRGALRRLDDDDNTYVPASADTVSRRPASRKSRPRARPSSSNSNESSTENRSEQEESEDEDRKAVGPAPLDIDTDEEAPAELRDIPSPASQTKVDFARDRHVASITGRLRPSTISRAFLTPPSVRARPYLSPTLSSDLEQEEEQTRWTESYGKAHTKNRGRKPRHPFRSILLSEWESGHPVDLFFPALTSPAPSISSSRFTFDSPSVPSAVNKHIDSFILPPVSSAATSFTGISSLPGTPLSPSASPMSSLASSPVPSTRLLPASAIDLSVGATIAPPSRWSVPLFKASS